MPTAPERGLDNEGVQVSHPRSQPGSGRACSSEATVVREGVVCAGVRDRQTDRENTNPIGSPE